MTDQGNTKQTQVWLQGSNLRALGRAKKVDSAETNTNFSLHEKLLLCDKCIKNLFGPFRAKGRLNKNTRRGQKILK